MSTQISRKSLQLRVDWLNKALGRPLEPWTKVPGGCKGNVGNFHLDHCLGGWRVEEMLECGGAHPRFGQTRMSKGALLNLLEAVLTGIELSKKQITTELTV